MKDDPIGEGLLAVIIVVGLAVVLCPAWVIRVLSFGAMGTQDVNATVLLATRIIAGISAIYGIGYVTWQIFRS